jgi:transcriptional regulator with XRE-family HTH domain
MTPPSRQPRDATTYVAELAANIRAERSRRGLSQKSLAARMRELGFAWSPQLVAKLEAGNRPLLAGELLGLCLCLNCSMPALIAASEDDHQIELTPDIAVTSAVVRDLAEGTYRRAIRWNDDDTIASDDDGKGAAWAVSVSGGRTPRQPPARPRSASDAASGPARCMSPASVSSAASARPR